jgi:hypothetical protein
VEISDGMSDDRFGAILQDRSGRYHNLLVSHRPKRLQKLLFIKNSSSSCLKHKHGVWLWYRGHGPHRYRERRGIAGGGEDQVKESKLDGDPAAAEKELKDLSRLLGSGILVLQQEMKGSCSFPQQAE